MVKGYFQDFLGTATTIKATKYALQLTRPFEKCMLDSHLPYTSNLLMIRIKNDSKLDNYLHQTIRFLRFKSAPTYYRQRICKLTEVTRWRITAINSFISTTKSPWEQVKHFCWQLCCQPILYTFGYYGLNYHVDELSQV